MATQNFIPKNLTDYITLEDGKKLYLTKHSKDRIKTRKISEEDIRKTFSNPDIIMPNRDFDNARNYMKIIGNKKLKMGIKDDAEPFVLWRVSHDLILKPSIKYLKIANEMLQNSMKSSETHHNHSIYPIV